MGEVVLGVIAGALAVAVAVLWTRAQRQQRRIADLDLEREQRARALDEQTRREGESRRRLEEALDAIPQGVFILDPAGTIVYSNSVAAGFESARHGDALVAAAVEEVVGDALNGHADVRSVELFGPPKRLLFITAQPLLRDGASIGAVAVIDDVSERRRVDDMRRDFVANISHELKTPVGAISLLAETLVAEEDIDVTQRLAGRIVNESARVSRTIDDLLELSRIESEEAPQAETVAASDVVADALARIRPAAEQAVIPLEVMAVDERLTVEGDRRQITSALSNLLDNAIKYSDPGSPVLVGARAQDGKTALWVRDHGIGIPARDIERVFERFYRVDQARSRRTGGTGLGLAIVRHVAHNHDGEVTVESRLGEGSTFTLLLPAGAPLERNATSTGHSGTTGVSGSSGSGARAQPSSHDPTEEAVRVGEPRKAG